MRASGEARREPADGDEPQNGFYISAPTEFAKILEDWRSDGRLAGLDREREATLPCEAELWR